ncbi:Na(+)/H(+)-K(+) antiporter GerN [Koleobacter methoxysyntrophicus]|uniref:Na(+)/H(+)-K(+) antiporter GerN n=1 Tax=Koleobacter methoxysyntrophicus TaxID=2751313 RepID=A0A8A0RJ06_9FIRM|nr:cation:proton antiporter [Koleobacter methoxysyntrophicus]QSQ08431.1 Na(+)/H(+)-K(+) antiporter GerN [Koleobacter methoxysyntrophicus]
MSLLELAVILLTTKIMGFISKRFAQPAVLGELLAGLILGPSLLGIIKDSSMLRDLAEIGVILLMFIAGLETDVQELAESGKSSSLTALGGVILPLAGGTLFALYFGKTLTQSLFLGTVLTATSVSISVQTLMEMNKLKSREGITILGAAVIDDILGIIILTMVAGYIMGTNSLGLLIIKMTGFFVLTYIFGRVLVRKLARLFAHAPIKEGLTTITLVIIFVFAYLAERAGIAAIIGAYMAGLLFSNAPYRDKISHRMHVIAYSLFVPIFFISIGVRAQIKMAAVSVPFVLLFIAVAVLSKAIGCGIGAYLSGFNPMGAIRIGTGMIARGEVALIVGSLGLKMGIIDKSIFSIIVVMVIFTTLVTPILLKTVFKTKETYQEG